MKKIAKVFAVFAAIALLGTAVSCNSSDDGSDPFAKNPQPVGPSGGGGGDSISGDTLVFNVTADGGTAEDTVLFVKYDRSAAGADELISITNAEFNIWRNDSLIKTYTTIEFALDEYGSSFSGAQTPITDQADMKEYKVKLPVGSTVKKGDVIKVKLAKGTIAGPGKAVVKPENIQVALIDITAPAYYKEISDTEYQPLVSSTPVQPEDDPDDANYKKVITLVKNTYATNPESQAKVETGIERVAVGNKVTVKMKGKATRAFKAELFIVDTTKAANYWKELAPKYPADAEGGTPTEFIFPAEFTFEHSFEITEAPAGTGSTSVMFAINALDGDDTIKLKCTEYSIVRTGDLPDPTPTPTEKTIDVAVNHYDGADHGIQYTEAVATCIPAGAKSGDVYTLKMVGTADAEFTANLLFVNGSWAGITGEAIPVTFTTTEFTIEKDFTFSADTDADCKFMLTNAEMNPAVAKKLTLKEYSFTKKGATPTPTPTGSVTLTNCKAYTLSVNKDIARSNVGLTFQLFDGASTVNVTNLKVSVKIGNEAAVEKTFDSAKIEHHSWDADPTESNWRGNLNLGDGTIAQGTEVVLQVLAATVDDRSKVDGITFALQGDGAGNDYDMRTVASSKAFANPS